MGAFQAVKPQPKDKCSDNVLTTHGSIGKQVPLSHHIFSKGEWRRARLRDHPRVPITIALDKPRQSTIGSRHHATAPLADVSAIADTGAQSDLWALSDFLACGFSNDDLRPVRMSLSAANRSPISIEGAFFAKLTTKSPQGGESSCRSMVYVSSSVHDMYLSYESLLDLGLLADGGFQYIRNVANPHDQRQDESQESETPRSQGTPIINATRSINDGCDAATEPHNPSCSCPQRQAPPLRPSELPFPCTLENKERMKTWLLERYASSTFNTCPHRPLQCMDVPPVEIHMESTATPKACHTPASIPLHWQQRVHEDLLRDEALGVIERVPYGEPVTWCHRMVISRKHDGSPRRTVDLSPLNKFL